MFITFVCIVVVVVVVVVLGLLQFFRRRVRMVVRMVMRMMMVTHRRDVVQTRTLVFGQAFILTHDARTIRPVIQGIIRRFHHAQPTRRRTRILTRARHAFVVGAIPIPKRIPPSVNVPHIRGTITYVVRLLFSRFIARHAFTSRHVVLFAHPLTASMRRRSALRRVRVGNVTKLTPIVPDAPPGNALVF